MARFLAGDLRIWGSSHLVERDGGNKGFFRAGSIEGMGGCIGDAYILG